MISQISIITIILLFHIIFASVLEPNDIRNYLGTRTPYRFVYSKTKDGFVAFKYENCQAVKIWMLVRHGTRYPGEKDIKGMQSTLTDLKYEILLNHQMGNGNLSSDQLEQLKAWSNKAVVEQAKYLVPEGEEEMVLMAERMQKKFPKVIKNKYDNESFVFRYTATQRAQQSAKYFTIGLFDKKKANDVYFYPATKADPVLRFYKQCDRWLQQVKRNESTYAEAMKFSESDLMKKTLHSMREKLGLTRELSLAEAILMYKVCGFETSWFKHQISPWCAPLDQHSAQVFEYHNDLKLYWKDGYGQELTYKQACLSVKDMFHSFSTKDSPNATFLFAHSGTILKVLSHLQLYRPRSHLKGDRLDLERPWKTSKIDCFASNIAFVLYKCKDGDKVLTLHQETPVLLPNCETELCPLDKMKEYFHETIHDCNYSDICSLAVRNEL